MTNYKQAPGNDKRGGNKKDGYRPDRRQTKAQSQAAEERWLAAGFTYRRFRGGLRLTYSWPGDFPVFKLAPGSVTDDTETHAGLIARYSPADIEILFPYGTRPVDIATRLNDEILEIVRLQADAADPLPISPIIPFLGEPLPYQPIVIEGQEIGPDIGF